MSNMFGNTNTQEELPDFKKRNIEETKEVRRNAREEIFRKRRHLLMGDAQPNVNET